MTAYRDDNPAGLALAISDNGQWPPLSADLKSYYNSIVSTAKDTVLGMHEEMHAARLALMHKLIKEQFLESLKARVHGEYINISFVLTFHKSELSSANSVKRLFRHRDLLFNQIRKDFRAAGWLLNGNFDYEEKCFWPFLGRKERHKFKLAFNCSPLNELND